MDKKMIEEVIQVKRVILDAIPEDRFSLASIIVALLEVAKEMTVQTLEGE